MPDTSTILTDLITRLGGPVTIHEIAYQARKLGLTITTGELLARLDDMAGAGTIAATSYASPEVANNIEKHLASLNEAALSVSQHPTVEPQKSAPIRRGEGGQ